MQNYVSIVSYQSNGFAAWYFCFYACDVGGKFLFFCLMFLQSFMLDNVLVFDPHGIFLLKDGQG